MENGFLIGTDIGTLGTKSVLMDTTGKIIATAFTEYGILTPKALWAEQWPDIWVAAVKKTIQEIVQSSRVTPQKIAGICISGLYGGSGIPCDHHMEPVRPCLIWMDRRAAKESQWVAENIGLKGLYSITKNGADPYYGFTKILWIKNNEPENWRKIRIFLPPNAYVIYHLTGEIAMDYSSAGNIGGFFDIKNRRWSKDLLAAMAIPESCMPGRLVASSDIVGGLTPAAGQELGLPTGLPVCAGGIDCVVATLSAGVLAPGEHVAVLGTSMSWGVVHKKPLSSNQLISMPYVKDPLHLLYSFGGAATAGALPRWFRDNFAEIEKKAELSGGENAYAKLDAEAEGIPPGSEGLIVLPYFMGERSPVWDVNARGTIFGLTLYHRKAHVYRAFLESVAYSLRHSMENIETGIKLGNECILVGGVTKSRLWKQIFADVTGFPVMSPKRSIEAPLGDVLLAGMGTGLLEDFSVIQQWLDFEEKVIPNPDNHRIYNDFFQQYLDLYPALASNMNNLVKVTKAHTKEG
jgi:sugar (pentulose or hexulose) kinase